jgi:hypothetical protein
MAIRFYCPFCNRLLGISQRQAGAVVECPSCHGKVGMPIEGGTRREEGPQPPVPPIFPRHAGIVLSWGQLMALVLAVGLMVCVSFAVGLLVGALTS